MNWQGGCLDSITSTAFKLLDELKNLITGDRGLNDNTNICVDNHADNAMTMSYYAKQLVDVFV
ncbi:hypothetical protein MBANPS3_009855 [Mucor bainieri]